MTDPSLQPSAFLLYASEQGAMRVDVVLHDKTVWLTQDQMAKLFNKSRSTITEHIGNIFEEGELDGQAVCRNFRRTGSDGKSYDVQYYNLDVILSVGYRVKSHRGTQFRIWATERLREYLIKGFTMDDNRLKRAGGGNYFEELLARIRDIRSSERVFWRKVLDIYATSIDYNKDAEMTKQFFQTVQNKMHWAVHGQTAAEVIMERADALKPHMGLTTWERSKPRKTDVTIAKNYLTPEELDGLNRIVTAYLEFAELQALRRHSMTMADWIRKLDDFLKLNERDILSHAGRISHEQAIAKAEGEFEKFHREQGALPEPVDEHFDEALQKLKLLRDKKGPAKKSTKRRARKRV